MSIEILEVSNNTSIEYLLGLVRSRSGISLHPDTILAVQVEKDTYGGNVVIFKMKNGRPSQTLQLSNQELEMMSKIGALNISLPGSSDWGLPAMHPNRGIVHVPEDRLDLATRFLEQRSTKIETIANKEDVTGIYYQTFSDTKQGNPVWRVIVEHVNAKGFPNRTGSKTTIYLAESDYARLVSISGGPDMVQSGTARPIHKTKCSVVAEKIPRMTATKHYDPLTVKSMLVESTFAMKCKCELGFFCPNILISVNKGIDFQSWLNQTDKPNKSGPSHFWLAVPVYNSILYSFRVRRSIMEDWNGNRLERLMAWGISEDETFFFEVPDLSHEDGAKYLTIMRDMRAYIDRIYDIVSSEVWALNIAQMIVSNAMVPCKAKSHNYGTNKKIHDAMHASRKDDDFQKAFTISMELYEMCNFCYTNANPAFSLIPDLSS